MKDYEQEVRAEAWRLAYADEEKNRANQRKRERVNGPKPEHRDDPQPASGDSSQNSQFASSQPWPEISEEAYLGLAGEIVNTIKPHTEADPVAVLIQFLSCAGNVMGRSHYYVVESDRHHPNLFVNIVGETGRSRKGTSYGRVKAVLKIADSEWASNRTKGGLSSGEGFINEVRDPVNKWSAKDQEWELVDPGVADKRLLIIEPEFASALSVMERHGNILSPMIRKAWDGDKLATMTKNSPLSATDAHISIISHITEQELRARLTRTDAANGFANRFLFVLAKRSKHLPFGGNLPDDEILKLGRKLKEALARLPALHERIRMTEAAKTAWEGVYPELTATKRGLVGATTARGEAHTIRIAMIYALLEGSEQIDLPHLKAGLAVWEYCEASAAHIFGEVVGDPVADEIVAALKSAPNGLTKTQIHAVFSRHLSAERLSVALTLLADQKLVTGELREHEGKSVAVWRLSKGDSCEHAN